MENYGNNLDHLKNNSLANKMEKNSKENYDGTFFKDNEDKVQFDESLFDGTSININELYKAIFDKSPIAIILYNNAGEQLSINPACIELFGIQDRLEVTKYPLYKAINISESDIVRLRNLETVRYVTKYNFDKIKSKNIYKTKKSGILWLDILITPIDKNVKSGANTQFGYLVQIQDITEQKNAEAELKKSEEKHRLLSENAADIVWMLDLETLAFQYVSPSVEKVRGFTPEEAMRQSLKETLTSESYKKSIAELKAAMSDDPLEQEKYNKFRLYEHRQTCKDGRIIDTESRIKFFRDDDGKPIAVHGITRDVTERKRAEQELMSLYEQLKLSNSIIECHLLQKNAVIDELTTIKEELEQINAEKDKFFSIIAHDLKSPFSGFLMLTKTMAESIHEFTIDELYDNISKLQSSSLNLYKLIENLLEWSRMKRGVTRFEPENIDFSFIVQNNTHILSDMAAHKDIQLLSFIPENTIVYIDIPMINTVIRNLVSNAIKFTPRGGKIEIGVVDSFSPDGISNELNIFIKDTGIGMDKDMLNKLFQLDQKVSRPGTEDEPSTGLGLLLCKEFIEKNGGKIWVESTVDKGSTFYFSMKKG